jgi:hypothetical protein
MILMSSDEPVSLIGREGMDFVPGGYTMSHAAGRRETVAQAARHERTRRDSAYSRGQGILAECAAPDPPLFRRCTSMASVESRRQFRHRAFHSTSMNLESRAEQGRYGSRVVVELRLGPERWRRRLPRAVRGNRGNSRMNETCLPDQFPRCG